MYFGLCSKAILYWSWYEIAKLFVIKGSDENGKYGPEEDVACTPNPKTVNMVQNGVIYTQNDKKGDQRCYEQDFEGNKNKNIDNRFIVFVVVQILYWLSWDIVDQNIDVIGYFSLFPVCFKSFYATGDPWYYWDNWESPDGDHIEVT